MAIPWEPNPTRPVVDEGEEAARPGIGGALLIALPVSLLLWLAIGLAAGRLVARLMGGG